MGEFLVHSSVVWLNPHPSLGRIRKDPEMTVFGELRSGQSIPARRSFRPTSRALPRSAPLPPLPPRTETRTSAISFFFPPCFLLKRGCATLVWFGLETESLTCSEDSTGILKAKIRAAAVVLGSSAAGFYPPERPRRANLRS